MSDAPIDLRSLNSTHIFFKVFQAELVWSGEELRAVHAARVENDVCALRHPVAIYDVIRQGSAHGDVHHRVEAQALVDEALQHLQPLKVPVLQLPLACGDTTASYQFAEYTKLKLEHRGTTNGQ